MPLITWELWLARAVVADNPLPWQKSMAKLTPGRVAQSMGGVFSRDWYSGCSSQTPRKVSWMALRKTSANKTSMSNCQKRDFPA